MCARAFWRISAAFIGGMAEANAGTDEGYIWRRQHDPGRRYAAIGAIIRLGAAAHLLKCFEGSAGGALVFVNRHGFVLLKRYGPAPRNKGPDAGSQIVGNRHVDRAIQILGWTIGIGHHVPFKDIIGQPQRGAGIRNIHNA